MPKAFSILALTILCSLGSSAADNQSIARLWNEQILAAIRLDSPNPPVHARNLYHWSIAVYDCWAAYDHRAVGYLYHRKHLGLDSNSARREAISYASFRVLTHRYSLSRSAPQTLASLHSYMTSLGYTTNDYSTDTTLPKGVGNSIAAAVIAYFRDDGARESEKYKDFTPQQGGYTPINAPLNTLLNNTLVQDVNFWQPLFITNATGQDGIPLAPLQTFVGAHWRDVRPFTLSQTAAQVLWMDPGPPPRLNGEGDARFREEVIEVILRSSDLNADSSALVDISPQTLGNNSLGANDGHGHPLNPFTGAPYAASIVRSGDFSRALTEFWADGPASETPPGHWNTIANDVNDHPALERRLGGSGPLLDPLEWDVKLYFALNAALHDAACAAWSIKRVYDSSRPITMIRYMGGRGQSSDRNHESYHPDGLPLTPGVVELASAETTSPGGRHFGYAPGTVLIRAWAGPPAKPETQVGGVDWILPQQWFPYQRSTFVTPAFPGYISGHSTFSRAAAEVLVAFTGSSFFPGGIYVHTIPANSFVAERGPSAAVPLQAATYYDAADLAGTSRLWGGIHVRSDDFTGRKIGSQCGLAAWNLAKKYFDGTIADERPSLAMERDAATGKLNLTFRTARAFGYRLEASGAAAGPFRSVAESSATNAVTSVSLSSDAAKEFFRILVNP